MDFGEFVVRENVLEKTSYNRHSHLYANDSSDCIGFFKHLLDTTLALAWSSILSVVEIEPSKLSLSAGDTVASDVIIIKLFFRVEVGV